MDVTLWTGPVGNAQVPGCVAPGSKLVTAFTCRNPFRNPIPTCNQIIEGYREGDRFLPRMLRSRQVDPANVGRVFIGSFSAGHNAVKERILKSADDRAMIGGVLLADSTYTDWIEGNPKKGAAPRPGYVAYMLDCLKQPKIFVATSGASTPPDLPSSSQSMWALANEVERLTGKKFQDFEFPASVSPRPLKAKMLRGDNGGLIVLADYGATVQHPDHALILAPQVWRSILNPWMGYDECGQPLRKQTDVLGADTSACAVTPKPEPFPAGLVPNPGEEGFVEPSEHPLAPSPDESGIPWANVAAVAGGIALGVALVQIFYPTRKSFAR